MGTKIEVVGDKESPTCAKVYIDGKEIHGVTAVRYAHYAGEVADMEIDLSGMSMAVHPLDMRIDEMCHVTIERG